MKFEHDPTAPERVIRRDFLSQLSAAGVAALAAGSPRLLSATEDEPLVQPAPTADACILIWMAGGMAAPDTLRSETTTIPFKEGLPVADMLSTFPAIDTAVDNIKICEGLENIAGVMDRATLIRSHVQPDLGSILHSRHQYHWHTGYVPPQTVAGPHLGAWMARVLGPRNPVMPAFVNIGQRLEGVGESEELKAFTTAGFFGSEFGPMNLPYPEQAAAVGPSAQGNGARTIRQSLSSLFRKLVDQQPAARLHERLSAGVDAAVDGKRVSPAGFQGAGGVRHLAGAEGEL